MKALTATKNIENRFDHSGTSKLSRRVPVSSIKLNPLFSELFLIDEDVLNSIIESMKKEGFYESKPLDVWKVKNEIILVEGHTRFTGAKKLGLYDVPVVEHFFASESEALEYALKAQFNRRNLSDAELISVIQKMDAEQKLTAAQLAKFTNVSQRKIERARSLIKNSDEESLEEFKQSGKTINSALPKPVKKDPDNFENDNKPPFGGLDEDFSSSEESSVANQKNNSTRSTTDDDDDPISDALDDNSGNPSPIMIHQEKPRDDSMYKLTPEQDSERTAERKNAYELGKQDGYKDGFERGYNEASNVIYEKIFELLDSGLSIEEVRNHELFEDLSYSVLSKKISNED